MTDIRLDSRVMSNIKNENLISMLNAVIDKELDKDVSQVDTALVEECIDLVLKLEQEEDSSFRAFVPLITSDEFMKRIIPNTGVWKKLNVFARVAVVAAVVATGTLSVNATVRAITGYDFVEEINKKIVAMINGDDENELDNAVLNEIEESTQPQSNEEENEEETGKPTQENDSAKNNTVNNDNKTNDKGTSSKPQGSSAGFVPSESVTAGNPFKPSKDKAFVGLYFDSSNMKKNYIYYEELSYDGLELYRVFDDGSKEWLSYTECDRTKNLDTTKVGDHTVKLVYDNTIVEIDVTVRPGEETRYSTICSNDDYDYLLTERGAYITKYKGHKKNIVLNSIDSNDVYSIESKVFASSDIESFYSSTLKKVSYSAFANCGALSQFAAPSLEIISNRAFQNTALEKVNVAKGVTRIDDYAFYGCSSLKEVNFLGEVEAIGGFAFCECTELEKITGTQNIRRVYDFAFYDNKLMTLDSGLKRLCYAGEYAFAFCSKISIDSVNNMEFIGEGAFKLGPSITNVHITGSTKAVAYEAFRGVRLESLTIDEGVEEIEDYAFMSSTIKTLKLPRSLKKIGEYSFYSGRLQMVYGGDNVKSVGSMAFYPSSRLTMQTLINSAMHRYAIENGINCVLYDENGGIITPDDEV